MSETITASIDSKVKRVVTNIRNLPTPPIVFHQIQKVINDPNVSAEHIASILSEDPGMSVKVLKLTNSAFYGLSREIDSVKQAVIIIGLEAIKNLVLSASVLDMFKGDNVDQEYQEKFWRHSLATAFCGRMMANKLRVRGMVNPDAAFSSGLLHDVGKIVISCFLPDEHKQLLQERAKDSTASDVEIEERILGYNHAQIGGFLAVQWKIPTRLVDAITFHHSPQICEAEDPIAYLIYLADYVAKKTFYDESEGDVIGVADETILEYMQVTEESLEPLGDQLREEYLKSETFMQMAGLSG